MKKIILAIALFLPLFASSQTIQMEKDGGVYKLPCKVNGVEMKMIFDTGASSVCLSLASALFLYQNGYIKDADIKGMGYSSTASGDIVDNMKIIIRDIEIAGKHLYNVEGVVMKSLDAPLLLGQSAIQKLGKITIDKNRLIIDSQTTSTHSNSTTHKVFKYHSTDFNVNDFIPILGRNIDKYLDYYGYKGTKRELLRLYIVHIIEQIKKGTCYKLDYKGLGLDITYYNSLSTKKEQKLFKEAVNYIYRGSEQYYEKVRLQNFNEY